MNGTDGYEWKAVGSRVVSSYAGERELMGENAGTTIAECFSPDHARRIAALPRLAAAAQTALDYLHEHLPKGNIRNSSHFHALNEHANTVCGPLHHALADATGGAA